MLRYEGKKMTEASSKAPEKIPDALDRGTLDFITTRRGLFKGLYGLFLAGGLAGLFYGLYRFLAPGGGAAPAVEIPLREIEARGDFAFQYGGSPGILIQGEDGSFRAFSLTCTHLACTVIWVPEKKQFYCPCHDGHFDGEGNVLSGPPPSPLERWRVQVKDDRILVGEG
jgi:nitrite reductase/ring-hydroxylating ferredoxin subunit